MRIVFFGSDDFAAAHLKSLIEAGKEVVGCVTQPDRPKGRGMQMSVSPLKSLAIEHNIPVLQPASLQDADFIAQLSALDVALFVVIAYGKLLPQDVLDIPDIYTINVHPSLLPRYRGAAPINWAIINGDAVTGISIIRLNVKMDAGDVIAQTEMNIEPRDTAVTLRARMVLIGAKLLLETIDNIGDQQIKPQPQDSSCVSLAPKLSKELGAINWKDQTAMQIHNLVRGLLPWPTAYTTYGGKVIKLLHTEYAGGHTDHRSGEVIHIDKAAITVAAKSGTVSICALLPASSKAMSADEFVRGYHVQVGQKMGL